MNSVWFCHVISRTMRVAEASCCVAAPTGSVRVSDAADGDPGTLVVLAPFVVQLMMEKQNLPKELCNRVEQYYSYLWHAHGTSEVSGAKFKNLSPALISYGGHTETHRSATHAEGKVCHRHGLYERDR